MGRVSRGINEAISKDRPQAERDGLKISDEVFELWEREIDGRHSMHGWYGSPRLVVLNGVRILDENGEQRSWPKAHGPFPCPDCSGTGHEKHGLDGSRIPGFGDCLACDGTGLKNDPIEEADGEIERGPLHYSSATSTCKGGRNDCADWSRVDCPDCLKSKPESEKKPEPGDDKPITLEFEVSILANDFRFCGLNCGYLSGRTALSARCYLFDEDLEQESPPSLGGQELRPRRCRQCRALAPSNVQLVPQHVDSPRAILEKQGVRIRQTWNRKDVSIDEMVETFPFGEVLLAMDKVGWKWRGATPTFVQLRDKARELLRDLEGGGLDSTETGGLEASRWGDKYTLRFPSQAVEGKERPAAGGPDPGHVGPGPCGTDGKEIDLTSAG